MRKILTSGSLIKALAIWLAFSTLAVTAIGLIGARPNTRAVILMGASLVLVWIAGGGTLMVLLRERARRWVQGVRLDWRLKFVLSCTLLALVEEAVTVGLTNLAPLFGVPFGSAYITASGNYLDVVALHSVVVFVPMFAAWAWLLQHYDFSPKAVFLLFGLSGILAEAGLSPQAFAEFGLWIFVYGLMVYLPAYTVPEGRAAARPKWWTYPLAVLLPGLSAVPVAVIVHLIHPVSIHFPPIPPGS